jgi:acyl-CoA thioesterase-1
MNRSPRFSVRSWIALALAAATFGCQTVSNDTGKAAEKPKPKAEAPPDWPNLARYRDENAHLAPPPDGATRVVFMGDSITDFWPKVGRFFPGKDYIDRGISGQTTPQMLVRFRPDVIDLKPRVVVILAGTNDLAGNTGPATPEMIEGNIASMAELARANGIRVVLSSILPVYDYPWNPGLQPAAEIVALNAWIRDYADKSGFVYLDYFSAMADARQGMKAEYSADGVHPNAAGYAVMEPLAETAIAEALAEK